MKRLLTLSAMMGFLALGSNLAKADLLSNGNFDRVHDVEVVPGFFLPQPDVWINSGFKTLSGPYNDDLSSESWAGPAPTPVTADGLLNPGGHTDPDWGVFFKAFGGNATTGDYANGKLYQDNPATAGLTYLLTGWAGAEANFSGFIAGGPTKALISLTFFDAGNVSLGGSTLDLVAAGLGTVNGQAFNYKQYSVTATAPAGTAYVRAEVDMLNGFSNPAGGGQAFVVDDFALVVPEPSVMALVLLGLAGLMARRRYCQA